MTRTRRQTRRKRRRRRMHWSGWGRQAPRGHARTVMLKKCGKKCFLGPRKSFPICTKGTCKVNSKGVYAAYIRAREWGKSARSYKGLARPSMKRGVYTRVAAKAKAILRKKGYKVGKSSKRKSRSRRSRSSKGGLSKCSKGSRHRLLGQTRHGRKIRKHGRYSRKCSKKRGRRSRRSRRR